jgi:hypothetical protein
LLNALESQGEYAPIPGLVYRRNGTIAVNPKQGANVAEAVVPAYCPERIVDSIFNSSPEHVTDFCEAMIRRGLKLR